jgi:hypothetical protein
MQMINRRQLGLTLMISSVVAAVVLQAMAGAMLSTESVHQESAKSAQSGFSVSTISVTVHSNPRYAIPLAACFTLGLAFALWPSRRPPRLT